MKRRLTLALLLCIIIPNILFGVEFVTRESDGTYVFECDATTSGKIRVKFGWDAIYVKGGPCAGRCGANMLGNRRDASKSTALTVAKYCCNETNSF